MNEYHQCLLFFYDRGTIIDCLLAETGVIYTENPRALLVIFWQLLEEKISTLSRLNERVLFTTSQFPVFEELIFAHI